MKQLKQKELKDLREKLYAEQKGICPLCKTKIRLDEAVIDHQHKTLKEEIGADGAGLVRGVLCHRCNTVEGGMINKFRRYGIYLKDYTQFLRNLADYLDQEPLPYIHPTEAPKIPKLGKRDFNKLLKLYKAKYPRRKKGLTYPKSGKLTKKWIDLLEEFKEDW